MYNFSIKKSNKVSSTTDVDTLQCAIMELLNSAQLYKNDLTHVQLYFHNL